MIFLVNHLVELIQGSEDDMAAELVIAYEEDMYNLAFSFTEELIKAEAIKEANKKGSIPRLNIPKEAWKLAERFMVEQIKYNKQLKEDCLALEMINDYKSEDPSN